MASQEESEVLKKMEVIAARARRSWNFSKDLGIAFTYYLSQAYWMGKNDK